MLNGVYPEKPPRMPRLKHSRHLLIVAGSLANAKWIAHIIKVSEFASNWKVATTEATNLSLLQKFTYDAVVCSEVFECGLSVSTPILPKVIELLKYLKQDLPIILVTGKLGNEVTVKFMDAGISNQAIRGTLLNLADVLQESLDILTSHQEKQINSTLNQKPSEQKVFEQLTTLAQEQPELNDFFQGIVNLVQENLSVSCGLCINTSLQLPFLDKYVFSTSTQGDKSPQLYEKITVDEDFWQHQSNKLLIFDLNNPILPPVIEPKIRNSTIRALAIVPLNYQQLNLGTIGIYDCQTAREWSKSEIQMLQMVASFCSMVTNQHQLGQKLQAQQNRESFLVSINQILTQSLTPEESLQQILSSIGKSFKLDRVILTKISGSQAQIQQEWKVDSQMPTLLGMEISVEQWQLIQPLEKTFYALNYPEYLSRCGNTNTVTQFYPHTSSLLSLPIYSGQQLVASLGLHTKYERSFTLEEVRTIELVANQVAIAVCQATNEAKLQKLASENQSLAQANRDTAAFLDHTSHELRTPLTGIIGFSRLLGEQIYGPLNDKQMQYIAALSNCGEHLLELVNDLLDLSRIDAGREQLYIEELPVEDVCRGALSLVQQQANQANLELKLDIAPDITVCKGDGRRLKQILVNLLSNGVKYTDEGSVNLKVSQDEQQMCFSVIDTGIGMTAEEIKSLFKPFHRINSLEHRKRPGTGLGLALSLKLAQLHGGNITVTSEPNQGSCFTLSLPN